MYQWEAPLELFRTLKCVMCTLDSAVVGLENFKSELLHS